MGKKALYTGSFDPLTYGHLDMIQRAAKMFDELVVGVIANPAKKPLFTVEEREEMIRDVVGDIPNVKVDHFTGLLADYVNSEGFDIVVRGLRATTDFEYELQMAHMNARLFKDKVETIFLMTQPEYSFISSSMMKEVRSLGGSVEGLVPDKILECMDKKLKG
ncbi:MAG: pantetheine-phosphate adenylyltransferase [Firmicutes bacterium]|nr:pantetheine-phosphate adenylyltransferase [Bacillota bacterium]MBR2511610.1 pantetheine-phosphate adenylyltransferase [Bacillota bacterium]